MQGDLFLETGWLDSKSVSVISCSVHLGKQLQLTVQASRDADVTIGENEFDTPHLLMCDQISSIKTTFIDVTQTWITGFLTWSMVLKMRGRGQWKPPV